MITASPLLMRVTRSGIDIKSYDLETGPGRGQRKGKTDISETNNAKDQLFSLDNLQEAPPPGAIIGLNRS